jgi:hypothetical protein
VHDIVHKWNREPWVKMQCLETKGSSISTYLITSYFTTPLALMDKKISLPLCISSLHISSMSLASHHFLFHPCHLHLITSYFTPPLASMDKKITHFHIVEWHYKSLSLVCMEPISSISNWSKRVLSISNILFNDPWSFNDDYEIW